MNDELYHYGILGQKWGLRRFQFPDGTYTPAGKKRRNSGGEKTKVQEEKDAVKNRRELSDEELNKRIDRLKREKQLKDLTEDDIAPGKKFVKEVMSSSGKKVATTVVTGAALYAIKNRLTKEFDAKDFAGYVAPKPKNK